MKFKLLILLSILSIIFAAEEKCPSNEAVIESTIGKLKGKCSIVSIEKEKINLYKWLAVPYAEPPVGDKRFKAPESKKTLKKPLEASEIPNSCMQLINKKLSDKLKFSHPYELADDSISKPSEDCLYLNIYVPKKDFKIKKKPILIVIHGGDGTTGTGSLDIQEPSVFAAMTNTIVVTVNYRLGIFGFLQIEGNNDIQGNQGFLDQHMAMKWVKDNAEKFGGDINKISLMGYGSGARFIGMHLMYKPSHELFRNVILQSGSPVNLADNLLSKRAADKRINHFIDTYYKCGSSSKFNCIKDINAFNLTLNSRLYLVNHMSNKSLLAALKIKTLFEPIVDGKIITESPIKAFRTGNYKPCKMIVGFNSNDGSSEIPLNYGLVSSGKLQTHNGVKMRQVVNFESFVKFIRKYYKFYPIYPMSRNIKTIHNAIIKHYTNYTMESYRKKDKKQKSNYFFTLRTLLTDEASACPTFKFIHYAEKKSDIYTYIYSHRMQTSKYPIWYGVVKGDELASVFGQPFRKVSDKRVSYNPWLESGSYKYSENDKKISKDLILRWANFIHNDDPNEEIKGQAWSKGIKFTKWPIYKSIKSDKKERLYLAISNDSTKIQKIINMKNCHTWNHSVPSKIPRK